MAVAEQGWHMDTQKLAEFLVAAREKCSYETVGETGETSLPDGTKLIGPYTAGQLSYTDRYNGFEWFTGREEITEGGKLVWERKYEGGVVDDRFKERSLALKLFDVLKLCLRQFPRNEPFKRGPNDLKINGYEYRDLCEGDMTSFDGKEQVFYDGKEVHVFNYHGGLVR